MLRRQKTVLALMAEIGCPINSTTLVKLMFLLRQETELKNDSAFYDFVPYRYGPFSFALYRELSTLRRDGYIFESANQIGFPADMKAAAIDKANELEERTLVAVRQICRDYAKLKSKVLVKTVYNAYPWYTINSDLLDLVPHDRPPRYIAPKQVYTIGYQGKSVDEFFSILIQKGLSTILDVRYNPISRKYGFARSSLRSIAKKLGMRYEHVPELGIPGTYRAKLSDFASYQRLLDKYEKSILPLRSEEIDEAGRIIEESPTVLVCAEQDVQCCHRSRLAHAVSAQRSLPVTHLD